MLFQQHINDAGQCPEYTEINDKEPSIIMSINPDENLDGKKKSPVENMSNTDIIQLHSLEDVEPRNEAHLVQQNNMLSGRNGSEIIYESFNFDENCWNDRQDLQDLVQNSTEEDLLDKLSESVKSCMTIVELDKVYRCEYCER